MYINSIGYYIPNKRVPNSYFTAINGLDDLWIQQRTGIKTRAWAGENETQETMGLAAVAALRSKLPYPISDIDLIISASYTPLDTVATLAHLVQREHNIPNAAALMLSSACSSFVNALEVAEGYFAMGKASKALIVCSEHNSLYCDATNKNSGHIWGDAAVAVSVSKERCNESDIRIIEIVTHGLGHIGKGKGGVCLQPKTTDIVMGDGRDVFNYATKNMVEVVEFLASKNAIKIADLAAIFCHQANLRIVMQVAHQLGLPMEKFPSNIQDLGNTGAGSSALVLAQAIENKHLKKGDIIALSVFGGGYSSGGFLAEI